MDPYFLIAQLRARGLTQTSIAWELDVTPTAVHRVIFSKGKSLRIADCIAAALDETVEALWPGRYGHGDDPKPSIPRQIVPDPREARRDKVTRARSERRAA